MFKRVCIVLVMFFAVGLVGSCDPDKQTIVDPPVPAPDPLKEKDGTLNHLELLFNEFNPTEYDRLLADDFVFFFSASDFSSGKTPQQWDRTVELAVYSNFYDKNRSENRVVSTTLHLTYAADNWTEIDSDDPIGYPGEKWQQTTVTYDIAVVLDTNPELTLIANGLRAEITIRWAEGPGHWRIIRWRDDVDSLNSIVAGTTAIE